MCKSTQIYTGNTTSTSSDIAGIHTTAHPSTFPVLNGSTNINDYFRGIREVEKNTDHLRHQCMAFVITNRTLNDNQGEIINGLAAKSRLYSYSYVR